MVVVAILGTWYLIRPAMLTLQICLGGPIPDKYFRMNMLSENNDMSKFKTATVQKGSTLQLDYPITVPKSLLRWRIILT